MKFRLQNGRPFEWVMGSNVDLIGEAIDTSSEQIDFADANPDTIVRASGDFTTLFSPADVIVITGSTLNDGRYTIDTVVALTITLISTDVLVAETMVTGTLGISYPNSHTIINSNTVPSYSIEHVINPGGANSYSHKFFGSKCDELKLTMSKGNPVIAESKFVSALYEKELTPGTNTVNATVPFEFHQFTTLTINGVDYSTSCKQFSITIGNSLEREYGLASRNAVNVTEGIRKCMLNFEVWETDDTLQDLFENRTDFAIEVVLTRGTDTITLNVANAKIFSPSWDFGSNGIGDIVPTRVIGDWTIDFVDEIVTYDD